MDNYIYHSDYFILLFKELIIKMKLKKSSKFFAVDVRGSRREVRHFQSDAFRSNVLNAAAERIGFGILGIEIPDIVIWVSILLRGVYETALEYRFEYDTPVEKLFILKLIEASMMNSENWEKLNAEIDEYVSQEVFRISDEIMVRAQIEKTADALVKEYNLIFDHEISDSYSIYKKWK